MWARFYYCAGKQHWAEGKVLLGLPGPVLERSDPCDLPFQFPFY